MSATAERELKFEVAPADAARLRRYGLGKGAATTSLISVYFDSPAGALNKAGFTLRVRHAGDRYIQTIKAVSCSAGLFERGEWEREVEGPSPQLLPSDPLPSRTPRLYPVSESVVSRTTVVRRGIELALDQGEIRASRRRQPLCELELELVDGDLPVLFEEARRLDAIAPLRLSVLTKAERGRRLALGRRPAAVQAEPERLDPGADAATALRTIAGACLRHYRLNEDPLLAGGAPEFVHQARVALRRLRSGLALFRRVTGDDATHAMLVSELRWLAGRLGSVREIDVLLSQLAGEAAEIAMRHRAALWEAVATDVASARTRLMFIDLLAWLHCGAWADAAKDVLARDIADAALERQHRRLKRGVAALLDGEEEELHRLRIVGKKLRYGAEFFGSLYPERRRVARRKALAGALGQLQDRLGEWHDDLVAPGQLHALGLPHDVLPATDRAAQVQRCEQAARQLLELKRFWR